MDYNPVAVFIQKCALEYPAKYGRDLIDDVQDTAKAIQQEIYKTVSKFYPDSKMDDGILYGYRWCRTIPCMCGVTIPLVNSYVLSKKRKIYLYPNVEGNVVRFSVVGESYGIVPKDFDPTKGSIGGNVIKCVACGQTYTNTEMRAMFSKGKGGEQMMVAIYVHPKKRGRLYVEIDNDHTTIYKKSKAELEKQRTLFRTKYGIDPVPSDIMPTPDGREYREGSPYWGVLLVVMHGYTRWEHLFNTRQLLCLVSMLDIFRLTEAQLIARYGEEYGCAIMSYMALILNKTVEKYCRLSPWWSGNEMISHCFTSQSLKPTADYAEATPHYAWQQSTKSVLEGLRAALSASDGSTYVVRKGSATDLKYYDDEYFDAVCTDPPYYDSMQYSKTADFFYVWLKRTVGHLSPYKDLFRGVLSPKDDEVVETASRASGITDDTRHLVRDKDGYQYLMTKSLQEMHRVLKYDGVLTLVYAHKSTAGWETLIQAILDAGFVVTAAWPIDTEHQSRMKAQDAAALASSIYMVGRKWKKQPKAYYRDVLEELRAHVCGKLDQFMKQGISGADFYIAAIGVSCEVYGKYESVVRDDDGRQVTVADMLSDIRGICSDHIVKFLTSGAAGEIDAMSKLYISWRWAYGDRAVPYDVARKLFTGVGLNIDDYVGTILKKTGQTMIVLDYTRRERDIRTKNTIDILHKAMQLWRDQETGAMRELLVSTGNQGNPKFERIIQAIIEAGAAQPGVHLETAEKRDLEAFLSGRRSEAPGVHTGRLDDYMQGPVS
ncbi:MAG: DUF1156 domain-containing protein [Gemmatimonadetes bacterium]|nr:DUF1156 domain-containing protein [Gemmatimonadota bacterium]